LSHTEFFVQTGRPPENEYPDAFLVQTTGTPAPKPNESDWMPTYAPDAHVTPVVLTLWLRNSLSVFSNILALQARAMRGPVS
jgi:hypothetical protein